MKTIIARIAPIALVLLMTPAHSSTVPGQLLGVFSGNDSVAGLFNNLGLVVEQLAKIDTPDSIDGPSLSNDGLTISNLLLNTDNEALAGEWSYAGPGIAHIIAIKADGFYAVYATDNTNMGKFSVANITEFAGQEYGLSHITAYSIVPVPGALLLFTSGLLGLGLVRRR